MSTVLKALRRLERERTQRIARPIRQQVSAVAPGEPLVRSRTGQRVLFTLLAAGLASAAFLLITRSVPQIAPTGPELAAVPNLVLESPQLPAPALTTASTAVQPVAEEARETVAKPPVAPGTPGVAPAAGASASVTPHAADAARIARANFAPAPPAEPERLRPVERAAPLPAEAVVEASPSAAGISATLPSARSVVIPAPREPTAEPATEAAPIRAPALPDLSGLSRPDLVVQRTFWHPDAAKRSALVTMAGRETPLRVREGDVIGPLVLLAIEPSEVVFVHNGELIHEPVGAPE